MQEVTGKTKQLAILGNPVSHSFSPQMQNFMAEKTGIDCVYTALEVNENEFENAVKGLRAMNFRGVNITSPFKFQAYKLMDVLSDKAKKFGSVNTCVNRDGVLYGYNTDADGFYRSLLYNNIRVKDRDILFIGAGGATQPVMILFAQEGARSITIQNRTAEKAQKIADYTKSVTGYDVKVGIENRHYDVVINTTTCGMHPQENLLPIDNIDFIDSDTAVADMIYNPEKTLFLKKAEEKGAKIVNGLGMLIFQGIIAFELFTDTKLDDSIYKDILKEVFHKTEIK